MYRGGRLGKDHTVAQRLTATKHTRFTSWRTNVQHPLNIFATTVFLYMSLGANSPARKLRPSYESRSAAAGRAMTGFEHWNCLNHADTNQAGRLKVTRTTSNIVLMEMLASDKKIEKYRNTLPARSRAHTVYTLKLRFRKKSYKNKEKVLRFEPRRQKRGTDIGEEATQKYCNLQGGSRLKMNLYSWYRF